MRIAGQLKCGFYPFDPLLATELRTLFEWPDGPAAFLDPCCGHGEALRTWVPNDDRYSLWGIEISSERAEKAKASIGEHVMNAAFEHTRLSYAAFSAAWVNPPFDDEIGGGGRMELAFLRYVTDHMVAGGVVVLIAKTDKWNKSQSVPMHKYLNAYYEDVSAWWHPETERSGYSYTSTAIYVGRRRRTAIAPDPTLLISNWPTGDGFAPRYKIPRSGGPTRWEKTDMTDEELIALANASPLIRRQAAKVIQFGRPPLPLKLGHIPMVLASGRFNGVIHDHVARAKISKRWKTVSVDEVQGEDGATVEKEKQKEDVALSMKVISSRNGVLSIRDFAMEAPSNGQGQGPTEGEED